MAQRPTLRDMVDDVDSAMIRRADHMDAVIAYVLPKIVYRIAVADAAEQPPIVGLEANGAMRAQFQVRDDLQEIGEKSRVDEQVG